MKTKIQPIQFWPDYADTLSLENGVLRPPPTYAYTLLNSTTGKRFKTDFVMMPEADWNAWPAGLGPDGDANYQLDSICRTLNLTRA